MMREGDLGFLTVKPPFNVSVWPASLRRLAGNLDR